MEWEFYKNIISNQLLIKYFQEYLFNSRDFLDTLGKITLNGLATLKYILKGEFHFKEVMYQCYRFG